MRWLFVTILFSVSKVYGQLTAQSSVAPELRECYTSPFLVNRNNLPPTTMPVLIDIIRKIEDHPNVNVDLRQLAILLLHAYRQDGIEFHRPEGVLGLSSNVLPYAPTFHSFHRHRLLLTRILPSNLGALPENTVDPSLKCGLHHMLSTTVDARVRGDESSCNQLQQLRVLRTSRDLTHRLLKDDVEILDLEALNSANKRGQIKQYNPKDDVEYSNFNGARSEKQLLGDSMCPLLSGAVFTRWGAVSAGHVIAGIAAGAQLQRIPVLELAKGSVLNYPNVQQYVTSLFPATLSGDLAEAVLIQGTERGNAAISIGTAGNWNTTEAPRYYMLHSRLNVEITDPEIRGDIDGFVLGKAVTASLNSLSTLKLSQLLDMYYNARNGVFDPSLRACNRRSLSQQQITNTELVAETYAFAAALDTNMPLRGTIMGGLDSLVENAVTNFQSYTSSNLNDLNCFTTEEETVDYRLRTNLYLVIDAGWQYQTIYPAISYLLDNIDVGKFGSSVTLLSAFDGSTVINTTFSLADFHSMYTLERHLAMFNGISLENSLTNIRLAMQSVLENERTAGYVGGNSTVLLYLISGTLQNNQQVWEQARLLNDTVPDLRLLFATSTNQFDNLWNLVREMNNDIKTVSLNSDGTNVAAIMEPVLSRIQQVGRRIISPNCGSTFPREATSGIRQFDDYVEPGYINYYSISPNYFYENRDNRKIRISRTISGMGRLVICHSRVVAQPRRNSSIVGFEENAVTCQTIETTGNVEISLQNACDGHWTINSCPFFYISVESNVGTGLTSYSSICTENACRFPYNIRYQVQIEDLGCFSSAGSVTISVILLFTSALLHYIFRQ